MSFSLDKYITDKKKEQQQASRKTYADTEGQRQESVAIRKATYTPTSKPGGGSGFSLDNYIIGKSIRSGKSQTQDNDFDEWLKDLSGFSSRMASDAASRKDKYQDARAFDAYRTRTGGEIDELLKRAYGYQRYYTQFGKDYDQVYGTGASKKVLDAITQNIDYLTGVYSSLHEEGNYWAQWPDQGAYDEDIRLHTYTQMGSAYRDLGQYGVGNIDLYARPQYKNQDGSISTVESKSFGIDGKEILLPTIAYDVNGEAIRLTDQQAIDRYRKTGEYLGVFDTVEEATTYAQKLHDAQDFYYSSRPNQSKVTRGEQKLDVLGTLFAGGNNVEWEDSGWEDPFYAAVNGNEEARAFLKNRDHTYGYGSNDPMASAIGAFMDSATGGNPEMAEMTQEEISIFNYLYATKSPEEAYRYYSYIKSDLYRRDRETEQAYWEKEAAAHPVGASIFSVLTSPSKSLTYATQVGSYMGGGSIDQNAPTNKFSYIPSAIRGQVAGMINYENYGDVENQVKRKWGDVGSFAYQTGMSMADFLYQAFLMGGKAGGKIGEAGALALMGTGAAADTVIQKKDQGYSDDRAFILGTAAGAIEMLTEKMGYDALFGSGKMEKGAFRYFISNAASEGAEEGTSDIFNWVADWLYDVISGEDDSEWKRSVRAYMADGKTESEAVWQSILDHGGELAIDAAGGALSGGIMAGGGLGISAVGTKVQTGKIGADIRAKGQSAINTVISTGLDMDASTEAHRLAAQAMEKLEAGVDLTDQEIGKLYKANLQAAFSTITAEPLLNDTIQKVSEKGHATNDMAERILENPKALEALAQQTGLDLSEAMSKSQRRNAIKTALNGLASSTDSISDAQGEVSRPSPSTTNEGSKTTVHPMGTAQQTASSQFQEMAAALGENGAKAITDVGAHFADTYGAGISSMDIVEGFVAFYQAGVNGQGMGTVNNPYAAKLSLADRAAAYYAGQNDAKLSLDQEKEKAKYASTAGADSGLVYDDYVETTLDSKTASKINSVAKALGVRVRFVDSVRNGSANAQYQGSDILVEKNNPNPVLWLLGHEWTHRLQEIAPTQYRAFRDAVAPGLQEEVSRLLDHYRAHGVDITVEQAMDEAVANQAGRMIESSDILDNFIKNHKENRTLLEKVRDAIRHIAEKLTGAEKRKAKTVEEKLTAALEAGAKAAKSLQDGTARGTMGEAKNSLKDKWHTDLTKAEMKQVQEFMKRDITRSANSFTGTSNWFLTRVNGQDVFGIYSTEVPDNPTLLYEAKGERGLFERDALLDLMEGDYYGESSDGKASPIERWADRLRMQRPGEGLNRAGVLGAGSDGGNDAVHGRAPRRHPSAAFENVVRNLLQNEKQSAGDGVTFALKESVEETDRLIAWHNMSVDALRSAYELGGIAMPSFEEFGDGDTKYSIREDDPPKKTGIAYKVFVVKDGQLFPPMVANPGGAGTPVGVWLNADVGQTAPPSKTGRAQVQAGGPGTAASKQSLAFRPGWHLGDIPLAKQFARMNPETGVKDLFPANFVWAECEYAMDVDYQEEAMSYGYTESGKFRHAYAGLPKLPENGYYRYRTNPNPDTVPWVITGAMKVNRILSDAEVAEICQRAGVEAMKRQGGPIDLSQLGLNENGSAYSMKGSEDLNTNREALLRQQVEGLQERLAYWMKQTKRTTTPTIDSKAVRRFAKELTHGYKGIRYSDIEGDLQALYDYIVQNRGGDETELWLNAVDRARSIAQTIVNCAVTESDYYQEYSDLRSYLRTTQLALGPEYHGDIADFSDFRKRHFGRLDIRTDHTNIDQVYQEMSERWPGLFDEASETHPVDQLLHIAEVIDSIYAAKEESAFYGYEREAVDGIAAEIIEGFFDLPETKGTFADRQYAKLQEAKAHGKEAVRQQRLADDMYYGRKIAELRRKTQERTQAAIQKEKARMERRVQALKDHYAEVKRRQVGKRADSKDRTKLLNIIRRLQNAKLPAVNRALIQEMVGDIDTVAKGMTGKSVQNLMDLQNWYMDQKANNPDFISDPRIEKKLARLSQRHIADFTAQEVADLTEVLLNIENEIRTQRQLLDSEDRRDTYLLGDEAVRDIEATKGSKSSGPLAAWDRYIVTETLSPLRQMRRMTGYKDGSPLQMLTEALAKGQRDAMTYQMDAERPFREFSEDKGFSKAFSGSGAEEIKIVGQTKDGPVEVIITPAMRVSLYLHSLNDQNLRHIAEGGITVPDWKLYKKGEIAEAYARGVTVKLTPSQVRAIAQGMTAQERAFASKTAWYFTEVSQPAINRISETLKGYSIAQVEHYFPINTDTAFTKSDFEAVKFDGTIEGMGFLKERVNAANPIMLRDVNDVLYQAIRMHAKYVGLAIPVRNFNKVWGVTTGSFNEDGSRNNFEGSVQKAVKKRWGETGYNYVEKMMADLQGGQKTKNVWAKALNKVRSNYAGAVLTLNASVAMKQAASYPTAAAVLGWSPLARAMADFGKVDLDLIARYTPLQWYRSQGYSTKELGDMRSSNRQIPTVLNWVQGVDVVTTRKLWKASEYYVRANNKDLAVGSDAYYQAVADIYNRVIEETQPNYTTMQRPQLLRSDDTLLGNLAMFKTQPFQNFNILYDAAGNLAAKLRGGDTAALKEAKRTFRRAVTSQVAQLAVFAAMTMAWSMLRGKKDKYKGDEGEVTLWSVMAALGKDMVAGAFSGVPFGSDAWEFTSSKLFGDKYYGLDTVTVSAITDTLSSISGAMALVGSTVKAVASGEEVNWNSFRISADRYLDDISKTMGVPFENVVNLFNACAYQFLTKTKGEYLGGYRALWLTTDPEKYPGDFYDILYKARENDNSAYLELYDQMVKDGFSEDKIKNAMETRMKKAQGVKKASELDQRYLSPDDQIVYERAASMLTESDLWVTATADQQKVATDRLYTYITSDSKSNAELMEKLKDAGVDVGMYALYKLALEIADEPDDNGNLRTYTAQEKEDAINSMDGLTRAEKRALWLLAGGSEKNCPF